MKLKIKIELPIIWTDMGQGKTFVGSEKMKELGEDHNVIVCQKTILQICHTFGNVDIDDIRVNSENVEIVGVVRTCILYISSGKDPICMMELNVPFDYVADTVPLSDEDSVRVNPSLDQLSANM